MTRFVLASVLLANGLPGAAAPVAGSIRMIDPPSTAGPSVRRTDWLRNAPPSAVGGLNAVPTPPGGSPHGLALSPALEFPNWPQSALLKLAPSPPPA